MTRTMSSISVVPVLLAACVLALSHAPAVLGQAPTPTPPPPTPSPSPSSSCDVRAAQACIATLQTCLTGASNKDYCPCYKAAVTCIHDVQCWTEMAEFQCVEAVESGSAGAECPVSICDPDNVPTPTITTLPPFCNSTTLEYCQRQNLACVEGVHEPQIRCSCFANLTECSYHAGCWGPNQITECEPLQRSCQSFVPDVCQPHGSPPPTPTPSPSSCNPRAYVECAYDAQCNVTGSSKPDCDCVAKTTSCFNQYNCWGSQQADACEGALNTVGVTCPHTACDPNHVSTPTPIPSPDVCHPSEISPCADGLNECLEQSGGGNNTAGCNCVASFYACISAANCYNLPAMQQCESAFKSWNCSDSICHPGGGPTPIPTPSAPPTPHPAPSARAPSAQASTGSATHVTNMLGPVFAQHKIAKVLEGLFPDEQIVRKHKDSKTVNPIAKK